MITETLGTWTLHWIAASGEHLSASLQTMERDALVAACKLRRVASVAHHISGPEGRIIELEQIEAFCAGDPRCLRSSLPAWFV